MRRRDRFAPLAGAAVGAALAVATVVVAVGVIAPLVQPAIAQSGTTLRIVREDSTMVITNEGQAQDGARTVGNLPACEEGVLTTIFYGPGDGVLMVIDDETTLRSSVAIIRQAQEAGEGEEGRETVELLDGTVTFAQRPPCIEEFEPAGEPSVRLEQGRTTILATRFFLDEETDIANLSGPVDLTRAAGQEDEEELVASSDEMTYDLSTDRSTLTGNVVVVSGDRRSEAHELELDEAAGIALLRGTPAVSREGDDEIRGETLIYYLDSNDVIVQGNVGGTLEIELD